MNTHPTKWALYQAAREAEQDAEDAKLATMEDLYPVGAEIRWRHGGRLVHGVVTGHEARGDRLHYYNPRTGKRHFVYIGSVLDEMEGRER